MSIGTKEACNQGSQIRLTEHWWVGAPTILKIHVHLCGLKALKVGGLNWKQCKQDQKV